MLVSFGRRLIYSKKRQGIQGIGASPKKEAPQKKGAV